MQRGDSFYGPVYNHCIYNDKICLNILNSVQRQEYSVFITETYSMNQARIRQGIRVADDWGEDLRVLAVMVRRSQFENGTIFGYNINK